MYAVYKKPNTVTCRGIPTKEVDVEKGEDRSDEHWAPPDLDFQKRHLEEKYDHPRLFSELAAGGTSYLRLWAGEDRPANTPDEFGLGNSILVQLTSTDYLVIGWQVERFQLLAEGEVIERYESPIGNSDVLYPYAVGSVNTYLMIERAYIPNALRDETKWPDPYEQYYDCLHPRQGKGQAEGSSAPAPKPWKYNYSRTVVCGRQ